MAIYNTIYTYTIYRLHNRLTAKKNVWQPKREETSAEKATQLPKMATENFTEVNLDGVCSG